MEFASGNSRLHQTRDRVLPITPSLKGRLMPIANFTRNSLLRTVLPTLFMAILSGCAHESGQKSLAPGPDDTNRLPGIIVSGHSKTFHPQKKVVSPGQIYSPPPTATPEKTAKSTRPVPPPTRVHPLKRLPLQKAIYFAFNSKKISYANLSVLRAYANLLRTHPRLAIHLYGHTDPVGSKKFNRKLGLERALAARRVFLRGKVPASRVLVFSEGKRLFQGFPECKKPNPVCYARDRAVRIKVVTRKTLSGTSKIHKSKKRKR